MKTKIYSIDNYIQCANDFYVKLNTIMSGGRQVPYAGNKNRMFTIPENTQFRQAFRPNEIGFDELPVYYFVATDTSGIVLTISSGNIKYLSPNKRNQEPYCTYKFITAKSGKKKSISAHCLIGLVNGAEFTKRAKEIFAKKGLDAFGCYKKGEDCIQGHHTFNVLENPEKLYDATCIQFLTAEMHHILEQEKKNNTPEKVQNYTTRLNAVIIKEYGELPVCVITGAEKEGNHITQIEVLEKIPTMYFLPEASKFLIELLKVQREYQYHAYNQIDLK